MKAPTSSKALVRKPRIVPSAITGTSVSMKVRSLPWQEPVRCSERYSVHFAGRFAFRDSSAAAVMLT